MLTIPYKRKPTHANTQYVETRSQDQKWILQQARRLIELADLCEKEDVPEGLPLVTRNGNLPKQKTGKMNSCRTFCEGIIDNFNNGQYDFTEKQLEGITEAFAVVNRLAEEFEAVTFEEVRELPKLKSLIPPPDILFEKFSDLFEIEEITINYKKR